MNDPICEKKIQFFEVFIVTQQKRIWRASLRTQVWSLASLSGLRLWHCDELWCSLQTKLGSCVAVAVGQASGYSSDLIPSLGTFICHRTSPKRPKKKKKIQLFKRNIYLAFARNQTLLFVGKRRMGVLELDISYTLWLILTVSLWVIWSWVCFLTFLSLNFSVCKI